MDTLLQDIKYGARMLLKNPGFTIMAALAGYVPVLKTTRVDPMVALRYE